MSSNIDFLSIDGTYPIAGQDNDSQGFRDNFTNIQTNFRFAKEEITELENRSLLRSALPGTTLNNDVLGNPLFNFEQRRVAYSYVDRTALGTVDYAVGPYQFFTVSAPITISLTGSNINWPVAGKAAEVTLIFNVTGATRVVTLTAGVGGWKNAAGVQGAVVSSSSLALTLPVGEHVFKVYTDNAGSTLTLNETNKRLQPFNNTSESIAGNAVSVTDTTTVFSTANATATLSAGISGQVKILAAGNSNITVTVTDAGWQTSGTGNLVLSATGQTATLMYTNSKWFCIGNNGATFS
jgi:hypothetical protein